MNERNSRFVEQQLKPFIQYRHRRCQLTVVSLLLYTLLGFFALPAAIKYAIESQLPVITGRSATIERVEFNPYKLSLSLQGFELIDSDQQPLARFDEFFINFQTSSLFRWAWSFHEIRLTQPYILIERFDPQQSRLSKLLADIETIAAASNEDGEAEAIEAEVSTESGLPRLLIGQLILERGHIELRDRVPEQALIEQLTPIDIDIRQLNTLPNRHGEQKVRINLPGDASLKWQGSLSLAPLETEGELVLENLSLNDATTYLKSLAPIDAMTATLSSRLHYRVHEEASGEFDVDIDGLELELADISIAGLHPRSEFFSLASIALHGGSLRYPEHTVAFSSLRIDRPSITAALDDGGELNLAQLANASSGNNATGSEPTDVASPEADGEQPDWQIDIDELLLEGGTLAISDNSIQPPASFTIDQLQLQLLELNNRAGSRFALQLSALLADSGQLTLAGDVAAVPAVDVSANISVKQLPLSLAQPYLQQSLRATIHDGTLNSEIALTLPADGGPRLEGGLSIERLDIQDNIDNQPLLGWQELESDRYELDVDGARLHISRLLFKELFSRIVLDEQQRSNIEKLIIEQPTTADNDSDAENSKPFSLTLGGIVVDSGAMDFGDLSLPLPFMTHITALHGTIGTIATDSNKPASIRLEGQIDQYGLARINGAVTPMDPTADSDISLSFHNLAMANFSPYSAQFAGRKIASGKLDMGLIYDIRNSRLKGQNSILLQDLELGEDVDSEGASSLPLDLALSLLKDVDGKIDIELPVEGNVDDPEFAIGGVLWKAFTRLIIKVASSPFSALGEMLGLSGEQLGSIEYLAGRSDLTPPQLEKVTQLQQALLQRPQLHIEISGVAAASVDTPALQFIQLRDKVLARMGGDALRVRDSKQPMLDSEIRSHLEDIHRETFPQLSLRDIKRQHTAPPAEQPEAKAEFDQLAYAQDLRDRLLAAEAVDETQLLALATQRAMVLQQAFNQPGDNAGFDPRRIIIKPPQLIESEDSEWVTLELAIASNPVPVDSNLQTESNP